jgi:peptide-methionine (S)-S-oxide reductase
MNKKYYIHKYFNTTFQSNSIFKEIYFSMGCFWNKEKIFWEQHGVVFTEVGYAECTVDNPSCDDVFKENINHREVVRIIYNPNAIKLETLFELFHNNHTIDLLEEFPVPNLYKSNIYVTNEIDANIISNLILQLIQTRKKSGNKNSISTKVKYIENYKRAGDHHQQYLLKY